MKKNEWIDSEKAGIWWNQVSGPKAYLQEVVQNIKDGYCIALEKEDVDTEFFSFLEQKVRSIDSSYLFDVFRVGDYGSESDFQDDFIKRLAPEFDWGFASPYKELIEKGYIAHHLIYFEIDQKKDWAIQVVKTFSELSSQGNGVIVCLASSPSMLEGIGRLKRVSLGSYLSVYNLQYFALQCLGNFETRDSKGMYIAQIAAKLSDANGLFCAELAKPDLFFDSFKVCRNLSDDVVEKAVWETQIQIFLPIVEEVRRYLITSYLQKIQNLLPRTDEFGTDIEKPGEMELRHLQFYGRKAYARFFDPADDEWFKVAYNSRNELTHLHLLTVEAMNSLFDIEHALREKERKR